MSRNIQVKVYLRDVSSMKTKILEIKNMGDVTILEKTKQRNIFYKSNDGYLKLKMFDTGLGELVKGPRLSSYERKTETFPNILDGILSKSNGVLADIKRNRCVYIIGQMKVYLDNVEGLGDFIKLEVILTQNQSPEEGQKIADNMLTLLDIKKEDIINVSYLDLILTKND